MKFTVVIEQGDNSYGAYVPDLLGCIVAGNSKEEALQLIKEAIDFHIEGLKEDNDPLPKVHCEFAEVAVNYT